MGHANAQAAFDQKLLAPDGATEDRLGYSDAVSGSTALIGSYIDDDEGSKSGSAYLFDTTTGSLLHKLTAPDGEEDSLLASAATKDADTPGDKRLKKALFIIFFLSFLSMCIQVRTPLRTVFTCLMLIAHEQPYAILHGNICADEHGAYRWFNHPFSICT